MFSVTAANETMSVKQLSGVLAPNPGSDWYKSGKYVYIIFILQPNISNSLITSMFQISLADVFKLIECIDSNFSEKIKKKKKHPKCSRLKILFYAQCVD